MFPSSGCVTSTPDPRRRSTTIGSIAFGGGGDYQSPMMYALSKLLGFLLAPGTMMFLALVGGTALLWSRRWRVLGRRILTALVVILAVVFVSPLQSFLSGTLEDRFPANPKLPAHVDGIIVLGGSVDPYISLAHQQISFEDAAERLVYGARLGLEHPEARVLFTGGSADPWRPEDREAPWAAALLSQLGIPADRLIVEDQSRNTYENAVFSQRLAHPAAGQAWVLVTSARHMPRSVGIFRRIGWQVIPYPVDYKTGGESVWVNRDLPLYRLRLLSQAGHEWIGLVYYRLQGWTDSLFPGP